MKQLIYIALGLFMMSCSLNEDPRDQISEGEVYTSADALYLNTVATLYNDNVIHSLLLICFLLEFDVPSIGHPHCLPQSIDNP